ATGFLHHSRRGQGSGPIYLRNLACNGHETNINQCAYGIDVSACTHSDDVSVICSECGAINVTNGRPDSISSTGTSLTISCKDGFNADTYSSVCEVRTWTNNPIFCRSSLKIQSMRLANGIGLYDGRVELQVNGSWGTICGLSSLSSQTTYYFSTEEAEVICYSMFGKRSITSYDYYSRYGQGNGTVYIDQLRCNGNEESILDCNYVLNTTCSHYYDASVACNLAPLNFTDIRLIGNDSDAGRVEIKANNTWGTVCPNGIATNTANFICKMLNMSFTHFLTSWYDPGSAPILVDYLSCSSYYTTLTQCSHTSPYRGYYTKGDILSLICSDCGEANVVHGKITNYHNKTLTVTCNEGYDPPTIILHCVDGGWSGNATCIAAGYPLAIQDVRLSHGPYHGRVEVKVNNTWGTICGNEYDYRDAGVICKMFGVSRSSYGKATYGRGQGPIYMTNMGCTGSEKDIRNCSYAVKNNCTHSTDASVLCYGLPLNISEARIIDGPSQYIGRAEIKVNGTWGTMCDRSFSSYKDSYHLFCKMLGLKGAEFYSNSRYGQGSGPVYIDEIMCYPSTASLNECRYRSYNVCSHQRDVSIACYGPPLNISEVRLVNGTGPDDGRAEILINGKWGTICDDSFNINDTEAFCTMLGKKGAQFFTAAYHGQGTGPVHIDRLDCNSSSQSLSDCPYLYTNTCSHARDVSVGSILYADCSYYKKYVGVLELTCDNFTKKWITNGECQEYRFPLEVTDIRLVNGSAPGTGRVELKSMNTWGTICGDGFDINAANAICQMTGYPPAKTFYKSAHFGPGFGPIFIDDLACNANATHINNCSYITEDNCNHNNDISVVCTDCGNPTPANGFVNSTQSHLGAKVHVGCNNGYRLNGSET
ncbi:DMBT1-like protein, partial [Mya arenaria]